MFGITVSSYALHVLVIPLLWSPDRTRDECYSVYHLFSYKLKIPFIDTVSARLILNRNSRLGLRSHDASGATDRHCAAPTSDLKTGPPELSKPETRLQQALNARARSSQRNA